MRTKSLSVFSALLFTVVCLSVVGLNPAWAQDAEEPNSPTGLQDLQGTTVENHLAHFKIIIPPGFETVQPGVILDFTNELAEKELIHAWRHEPPERQEQLIAGITQSDLADVRQRYTFAYAPNAELVVGAPMILGVHYEADLTEDQLVQIQSGLVDNTPLFKNNIPGFVGVVRGKYIAAEHRFVYTFNTQIDSTRHRGVGSLIRTSYGFMIVNIFYGQPEYSSGLELNEGSARRHLASLNMFDEYSFARKKLGLLDRIGNALGFRIHFGVSDPQLGINPTFVLLCIIGFSVLGWLYKTNFSDE